MNNLIESTYALRILWGYIKNKIEIYNLKYLVLPLIYLTIILLVVPESNPVVTQITYTKLDSYLTINVTHEEKIEYILTKYNLSKYQFKVLCGIVLSEAQANSYEDAYAVINTIYNRTHSKSWVKYINNRYGKDKGENLYYQSIAPNQFTVYQSGRYQKNMNNTKSVGYDAIIDFLYTEEVMHNYLSFRSHSIKIKNSESFSNRGNNYFNTLKETNRI
ncbi:MAG: hypothetical protein E7161_04855 [Firmicutes bacterium]|nr:hypothetical protein [Bacillota bacterium]